MSKRPTAAPNPSRSYAEHVAERQRKAELALAASGFDALLIHSGTPHTYFADDQDAPHHVTPHFAHWLPLEGPGHLLLVRPGRRPKLMRLAPEDYWYEQTPLGKPFWARCFEIAEVSDRERGLKEARLEGRVAWISDDVGFARAHGVPGDCFNPAALLARLDWERSFKSAYEVECLREAERIAGRGHRAARESFEAGGDELAIHQAFMRAVGGTEAELPYPTIIALDEKAATLHYTGKRTGVKGKVLLIDAGARHLGYGSDITRTHTRRGVHKVFQQLVAGMDALQRELVAKVRPGMPYLDLHKAAHLAIAELLQQVGVLKLGAQESVAAGLTAPFFPHGLGHFLGIQVHDVAGRQAAPEGGVNPPPPHFPYLRTTRVIEEGQVFTVEPGLYFIEMLLRDHRNGAQRKLIEWKLVDELAPFGGIRIEDNVLVTKDGCENLTRPFVP